MKTINIKIKRSRIDKTRFDIDIYNDKKKGNSGYYNFNKDELKKLLNDEGDKL